MVLPQGPMGWRFLVQGYLAHHVRGFQKRFISLKNKKLFQEQLLIS